MSYITEMLQDFPTGKKLDRVERVFTKALKFEVFEGEILGYCPSCDDWYNQSRIGSPVCPKHRRMLINHQRVRKSMKL